MKPTLPVLLLSLLCSTLAFGDDGFSVTIVGQQQNKGIPLVFCPKAVTSKSNAPVVEDLSKNSFSVVIQNQGPVAKTITMNSSDWYGCLKFTITDHAGKIYTVARTEVNWAKNVPESWTVPSKGIRVHAVDFTKDSTDGWQGLPAVSKEPQLVSMTAAFTYINSSGKPTSVASKPTDVYLCSK